MIRIILFGAPGAGKGTQADSIEKKYGYTKISTGDLVRAEIKSQTKLGRKFKTVVEKGGLVPDDIIIKILKKRLRQKDIEKGYIIDGFPRTIQQAKALTEIAIDSEIAIYLKISKENVVVNRVLSRMTCTQCGAIFSSKEIPPKKEGICAVCGGIVKPRSDDTEEVIKNRLRVYRKETKSVIDYYRHKEELFEIDASRTIEEVFETITGILH